MQRLQHWSNPVDTPLRLGRWSRLGTSTQQRMSHCTLPKSHAEQHRTDQQGMVCIH
jgi:hypothetical protein